jgi:hypothetical protein
VSEAPPVSAEAPAPVVTAASPAAAAAADVAATVAAPASPAAEAMAVAAPWQPEWRPGDLLTARFLPMGRRLEVVTNSPRILAAAERSFGGYGRPEPASAAELSLRLYEHPRAGAAGAGALDLDGGRAARGGGRSDGHGDGGEAHGGGGPAPVPVLRCEGPYLYQASGPGSVLVVDRALGLAFGYVSPATAADAELLRAHYLEAALFYLLECRGFLGVHAAAVARGGRGLLLRAPSGQGKTTLAYAAARRGFQAVSEDVVWIEVARATWWGAPWTFHLLPDARRLFPELAGLPLERQPNGEAKLAVELESVRAGSTAPSAQAGAVVMLSRQHGSPSRLERLDPATARGDWLAGCAAREREVPGYDAAVAALLRGGSFRLRLGDDLEAALDLLEPLLP